MTQDKISVVVQIAYGIGVIGCCCALMYFCWGWIGAIIYSVFACLCLTPAILAARRYINNK